CPYFIFFLFFFQAEDGIRYRNVTGVQTCALPIYSHPKAIPIPPTLHPPLDFLGDLLFLPCIFGCVRSIICIKKETAHSNEPGHRSEERRVGKECRSWEETDD